MQRDIFPRQQGGSDTFGHPAPCAVNSTDVDLLGPSHQQRDIGLQSAVAGRQPPTNRTNNRRKQPFHPTTGSWTEGDLYQQQITGQFRAPVGRAVEGQFPVYCRLAEWRLWQLQRASSRVFRPSGQFIDARDPGTSIVGMLLAPASELWPARRRRISWKRHDVVTRVSSPNTLAEVHHSVLSPQPGVLGFGLLKNRDVEVGVLP